MKATLDISSNISTAHKRIRLPEFINHKRYDKLTSTLNIHRFFLHHHATIDHKYIDQLNFQQESCSTTAVNYFYLYK
jgi:hypothetical protein